ncbi:unnamed protein product [Paramecium sonneborni]|uniref:Uncharacterized protein n=1 Tax=Paramecium sonneborni TaxID=65129 RepID=A0A8S1RJI0_9CILI|nr:unnamed protein product [Paramecium sonneborni]
MAIGMKYILILKVVKQLIMNFMKMEQKLKHGRYFIKRRVKMIQTSLSVDFLITMEQNKVNGWSQMKTLMMI